MIKPVSILIIFVFCISGYILLSRTHHKYHQLRRSNGYHTFLLSCGAGLVLFALSLGMYELANSLCRALNWYPSLAKFILVDTIHINASVPDLVLSDVALITLFLSVLLPALYYRGSDEKFLGSLLNEYETDPENSEFTELFFRSLRFGLPILFTMSDRKVFIGYITSINYFDFNDIHVSPILSGYRNKDTLKLELVTPYQDVLDALAYEVTDSRRQVDESVFTVTLPLREIIHAHLYDFEYQDYFSLKEQGFQKTNEASFTDVAYVGETDKIDQFS